MIFLCISGFFLNLRDFIYCIHHFLVLLHSHCVTPNMKIIEIGVCYMHLHVVW